MISLYWRLPQLLSQPTAVHTEVDVELQCHHRFSLHTRHVCILTSHLCSAREYHPRPVLQGTGERPHPAPPVPITEDDKTTVRSLGIAFPRNHYMLTYEKSNWSKLPEVRCRLNQFSPSPPLSENRRANVLGNSAGVFPVIRNH